MADSPGHNRCIDVDRTPVWDMVQSAAIAQLASMGRLVVATGGGAILRPANW